MKKTELVVVDLDGTMVDSVPDIAKAVDEMMLALGQPEHGDDKVRHWVGNGVERMVKRALTEELWAEPDEAAYDKAYPVFMEAYERSNGKYSCMFPGVAEGLGALQQAGFRLACVTNKAADFTLPLLEALGVKHFFETIVSGDTLPHKKPRPEPLWHAADTLGVDRNMCTMVGDSQHDVEAARNAGFQVICVNYGYNHGEPIEDSKPDAVVSSLEELPGLLSSVG